MERRRELGFRVESVAQQLRGLRAYDPRRRRTALPGPFGVQIQTVDRCNASCRMCPYSFTEKQGPPNRMDDDLYERVLDELRGAGTVRVFALMLQNEPMIDRDLARRVRRAVEVLGPQTHVSIVTNGSMLSRRRLEELVGAGIGAIEVSIDSYRRETFETIRPGLSFERVVENTERLVERRNGARAVVRFLQQRANRGEAAAFREFWRTRGAEVRYLPLVNRAGSLDDYEVMRTEAPGPLQRVKKAAWEFLLRRAARGGRPTPCMLPFTWLNVLRDGRVILCCHDWGPTDTVGDLSAESLRDVWNGERLNHHRHLLWSGRYEQSAVCKDCSIAARDGVRTDRSPRPGPATG